MTAYVPAYLMEMPIEVLHQEAAGIEKWCNKNHKAIPSLLDLGNARALRGKPARTKRKRGGKR